MWYNYRSLAQNKMYPCSVFFLFFFALLVGPHEEGHLYTMRHGIFSRFVTRRESALVVPLVLLTLSLASVSRATPLLFNFAPGVDANGKSIATNTTLKNNQTFQASNGKSTLTAYGYGVNGTNMDDTADLYSRVTTGKPDLTGLGLSDGRGISNEYAIQLDFGALALSYGSLTFDIGNIPTGKSYTLYGSSTKGTIGTQITPTSSSSITSDTLAVAVSDKDFKKYEYFSIIGGGNDAAILLSNLSMTNTLPIPEPAFYQMGVLLAGGGLMALRLRRKGRA